MLRYMIFVYVLTNEDGVGLGWGRVGIIPNVSGATLHDLHLHLMLRYMIFTCTWCYAAWSSLALDATLHDLHLLALDAMLHDLHLRLMLRYMIFVYILTNEDGVGLGWGGVGIIPIGLVVRYMIFTCTWCYATWSSLALNATLHDVHLHLMRRYMIFVYILTDGEGWGWGGVVWGFGIIPTVSRATLHDLCTWCYATWSSLALDFLLHLVLYYMIFTCTWCYAT